MDLSINLAVNEDTPPNLFISIYCRTQLSIIAPNKPLTRDDKGNDIDYAGQSFTRIQVTPPISEGLEEGLKKMVAESAPTPSTSREERKSGPGAAPAKR